MEKRMPDPIEKNKGLLTITWPIFIEILLQMMMGNADTLMLSHYSDHSVAAVGLTNQLLSIIIVMFGFVATGASVVTARAIGAKNRKTASETAVIAICSNFLFGLVLSVLLVLFGETFLKWMNTPPELMGDAKQFLFIVGGFSFIQSVVMTIGAILRSYGFTKDAMKVTIGMNILNIIGNYLFIYGPGPFPVLGVQGTASSTVFSRLIGLFILFYLLKKRVPEPLPFRSVFSLPKQHLQDVLKIGLPAAGEHLSYSGSQMVITFFITMLGTQALTTKVYTFNLMMFIFLFSVSIGQGTQIVIAHLIGAGKKDKAYSTGVSSLKYAMAISLIMACIISACAKPLLSLFTQDPEVIKLSTILLYLSILLEPGRCFNLVIIASLRAAGDVKFPVFIGIVFMWGIGVPLSYVLAIWFHLGLVGIWIVFIVDEWVRGLFMIGRWRKKEWQKQSLILQH